MSMKIKIVIASILIFSTGFISGLTLKTDLISGLTLKTDLIGVYITSIEDRQEVHSHIVIDAVLDGVNEIAVYINGKYVANYVPYVWNNFLAPAGEYVIEVRGRTYSGDWISDRKTVIIPEEWIVPADYVFTENFVVHPGQTVILKGIVKYVRSSEYTEEYASVEECTWLYVTIYGSLILDNATVKCYRISVEGNGTLTLMNRARVLTVYYGEEKLPGGYSIIGAENFIRLDDNAVLHLDGTYSYSATDITGFYTISINGEQINSAALFDNAKITSD